MSTEAIVMMIIGCGGLWGGFLVSCAIAIKCSKKKESEKAE